MFAFRKHKLRTKYAAQLLLVVLTAWSISSSSTTRDSSPYIPGELIIQLFDNSQPQLLLKDFQSIQLRPKRLLSGRLNIWLYEYDSLAAKSAGDEALLVSVSNHCRKP